MASHRDALPPEIEAAIADTGQALVDAWDSAQSGPPHRFAVYTDPEGDPEVAAGWMAMARMHATARAEIARLTAELAAARAEVDCGQDGPCAKAPGCARHWQERNRELVAELAAALAVVTSLYETRARAISDATPTLVAVSDEELATAYSVAHDQPIPHMAPLRDRTIAGIRAVRAKLGAAEVTEERVKAALCEHFKYEGHRDWSADARAILAYLRATAAKGGES